MDLKFVLERVPGVNRRFVYYLESQGYIQPTRVQKERIARRDYSEEDLRVIHETWKYYERGFSLQAAYGLGVKQDRVISYVMFTVPPKRREQVLEALKQLPEFIEAGVVYADTADFIVKASTGQEADVYQALVPLFAHAGLSGVPGLLRVVDRYVKSGKPSRKKGKPDMIAYLQLRVPSKDVTKVMETLKGFSEVVEASVVYGESDVIARVVVPSQDELDTLVMERIHGIPAVESTRTYIVVRNLFWARDGAGT